MAALLAALIATGNGFQPGNPIVPPPSGPVEPVTPPSGTTTDPTLLTTLRHVTTHNGWWRTSVTADQLAGTTTISRHTVTTPARDLRIRWGNHSNTSSAITGTASLVSGGVQYPLTWAGSESVTIQPGQMATSDPVAALQVEAGDTIYAVWEAPAGALLPDGSLGWDTPMRARYKGGYGGIVPATTGTVSGSPQGIYGLTLPAAQAIACLGDSILESGWMRRAAHAQGCAWADLSQWAEGIPTASLAGRLAPSDPPLFTLGLTEYATNQRGIPWQDAAARLIQQWQWMTAGPIPRLGQTTMVPYAGSADGWTTLDGQTAYDVGWRDGLNGWLRDGAPMSGGAFAETGTVGALRAGDVGHPLIGVCDIAAAAEATNAAGEPVWDVRLGRPTLDGVHPSRAGADLMEPTVAAWFAAHM